MDMSIILYTVMGAADTSKKWGDEGKMIRFTPEDLAGIAKQEKTSVWDLTWVQLSKAHYGTPCYAEDLKRANMPKGMTVNDPAYKTFMPHDIGQGKHSDVVWWLMNLFITNETLLAPSNVSASRGPLDVNAANAQIKVQEGFSGQVQAAIDSAVTPPKYPDAKQKAANLIVQINSHVAERRKALQEMQASKQAECAPAFAVTDYSAEATNLIEQLKQKKAQGLTCPEGQIKVPATGKCEVKAACGANQKYVAKTNKCESAGKTGRPAGNMQGGF
jgi:hypothetical protein